MMKVAVSSYSFSQAYRDGRLTFLESISKAKEMGFDGFEVVDFNLRSQFVDLVNHGLVNKDGEKVQPSEQEMQEQLIEFCKQIKAEADRVGIVITNYTCGADFQNTPLDEMVAHLKNQIDLAEILGASGLRHDVAHGARPGMPYQSFDSLLPRLAEGVRQVTEYAASKGIKTMSENHGFFAQDAYRVEKLMNAVNHPNYGWLVDMGNFTCADENPMISVGIAAPYAVYVHAKDFIIKPADGPNPGRGFFRSRAGNYLGGTIIGRGDVPVKTCLATLRNAGYDGYVAIEFEGIEDCFFALEVGLENLRRYINEIEEIPLKKVNF